MKRKKLTAEFWEEDRRQKQALAAYIATLEQRIAARKAAEQQD